MYNIIYSTHIILPQKHYVREVIILKGRGPLPYYIFYPYVSITRVRVCQ